MKTLRNILRYGADLFFLMRIPLLIPVWTILLLGWICGAGEVRPLGSLIHGTIFAEGRLWVTVGGFSLIVASIYIVNQIRDIETDRINRKLFILPDGHVSERAAWVLAALCTAAGIIVPHLLLGRRMTVLFLLSLLLGFAYNLPPFSLKNRPIGGVVANLIGHGCLTFLAGYYAANEAFGHAMTLTSGILPSLAAGFANAAVYLTTTIPDAAGDAKTGKITFTVKWGEKATAIAATVACAGSLAASFLIVCNAWVMIVPALISLVLFARFALVTQSGDAFKTFRFPVAVLSALVALFVPLYAVLLVVLLVVTRMYYKRRFNLVYPSFSSE